MHICVYINHTNRTSYIIKKISISWFLSCLLHLKGHPFSSITAGYSVRTKIGLSAPRKPHVFHTRCQVNFRRKNTVRHEKMGDTLGIMLDDGGYNGRIQW